MILAAVSGGLDSVALLWRLLHGPEPIHVHHVSLRNRISDRWGRWRAEDAAMVRVVPWLREHVRDFDYSESVVGRDSRADIVIVTAECATGIATGAVPRPRVFARGAAAHDFDRADVSGRQARAQGEWTRILGRDAPPIEFPIRTMTRAQMAAELPPELIAMTWSCRRPQLVAGRAVPCRECRPCRELAEQGVPVERDTVSEVA